MKLLSIIAMLMLSLSTVVNAREIELGTHNTVILDGRLDMLAIDQFAPAAVAKRMFLPEQETLYVLIASEGGQAGAAYELLSIIDSLPNTAVICKFCASGAGMIFAATKQKRLAIDKSVAIMHEMFQPKLTANIARNRSRLNDLIASSEAFDKVMYTSLKMRKKDYQSRINDKEWEIKGKELVDFKMADELITVKCIGERFPLIAPDTCSQ